MMTTTTTNKSVRHGWLLLLCGLCLYRGPSALAAPPGPQLLMQGQKALDQGNYSKAKVLLQKAAKLLPHWGVVRLELARALIHDGGTQPRIQEELQAALEALPKNPRVHFFSAVYWESQSRYKRALKHYKMALRLGHTADLACLRAAHLWLRQSEGEKAVPCLHTLLKRQRSLSFVHRLLARIYTREGQFADASKHWDRAVQRQPNSLSLQRRAYRFYTQTQRFIKERKLKRHWRKRLRTLQRGIRELSPKQKLRKLRPLLPSRR